MEDITRETLLGVRSLALPNLRLLSGPVLDLESISHVVETAFGGFALVVDPQDESD